MGLFSSINIAASGLSAQRFRSDVISDNIANVSTTRTQDGGPFKRSRVILASAQKYPTARSPFVPEILDDGVGKGVRVMEVQKDTSAGTRLFDPSHPDAIQSGPNAGYVELPNVNIVNEMVDLISASRAYEANTTVIQGAKEMFQQALAIGQ